MRCQTDSVQPADSPAEWPFHTVYLWDAQTRLAPLLLLVGAFGSWLTVDMLRWQTFHRSLDVALPWLALFHVLWPLFGPRGAAVRAQLGASWNWHSSLAPWSLRMLGPGHQGLAIRALVLLLALGMAFSAMFSRTWHQDWPPSWCWPSFCRCWANYGCIGVQVTHCCQHCYMAWAQVASMKPCQNTHVAWH